MQRLDHWLVKFGKSSGRADGILIILTDGNSLEFCSANPQARQDSFAEMNYRNRLHFLMLCCFTMAAGVLWRSGAVPLSPFFSKYGGDALWALMVFFGFGFLFPLLSTVRLMAVTLAFAWAIEFSQMIHTPWLDAIRAHRLGHAVLGSTFNWPDLPAYAVGVAIGGLWEIRRKLSL